mmetsp:Transcript_8470/g.26365  ORF Transcript_8470/g.26365 Transcript_8470/m.26365 type:complete len:549 (+) Transcript_8470:85-1731(+)
MEAGQAYVQGEVLRVKPSQASVRDLPLLQGLPENKQNNKLKVIHAGADLMEQYPPLPDERSCKDVIWGLIFTALAVGIGIYLYLNMDLFERINSQVSSTTAMPGTEPPEDIAVNVQGRDLALQPKRFLSALLAATVGAFVTANAYVLLAHHATTCVVWTGLIVSPTLFIAIGISLIAIGHKSYLLVGAAFLVAGLCNICMVMVWRRHIPFTVSVAKVVTDVIRDHCCLLVVPIVGAIATTIWCVVCMVAFVGYVLKNFPDSETSGSSDQAADTKAKDVSALIYVLLFLFAFVFAWGAGVMYNISHITTCGVFARWYYKGLATDSDSESSTDSEGGNRVRSPLWPSFKVAIGTSFGSNCLGSLLVAVVSALRQVAEQGERDAARDCDAVACVCFCILSCVLSCIEDMLEYFNEWAYVQCAVRGTSFCDSARITFALMTCSNMKYVVADLLLNSIVSLGGLVCGLLAALCAGITEYALGGGAERSLFCLAIGLVIGLPIGMTSLSTISSGTKTVLACFADDPEPLQVTHSFIASEFNTKIRGGIRGALGS